jgi:hypothetical protein
MPIPKAIEPAVIGVAIDVPCIGSKSDAIQDDMRWMARNSMEGQTEWNWRGRAIGMI